MNIDCDAFCDVTIATNNTFPQGISRAKFMKGRGVCVESPTLPGNRMGRMDIIKTTKPSHAGKLLDYLYADDLKLDLYYLLRLKGVPIVDYLPNEPKEVCLKRNQ